MTNVLEQSVSLGDVRLAYKGHACPLCYAASFTLCPFPWDPLDLAHETDQLSEGHKSQDIFWCFLKTKLLQVEIDSILTKWEISFWHSAVGQPVPSTERQSWQVPCEFSHLTIDRLSLSQNKSVFDNKNTQRKTHKWSVSEGTHSGCVLTLELYCLWRQREWLNSDATKAHLVTTMVFPVVMYERESWTMKNWCFPTVVVKDSWESLGLQGDQASQL